MFVCAPLVCLVPQGEPEKGIRSPGSKLTGDCDPPHECWEMNQGPLEEQLDSALNH